MEPKRSAMRNQTSGPDEIFVFRTEYSRINLLRAPCVVEGFAFFRSLLRLGRRASLDISF
jgi:hypothetical protein